MDQNLGEVSKPISKQRCYQPFVYIVELITKLVCTEIFSTNTKLWQT